MPVILYPHQKRALDAVKDMNKIALYHDMGLGKTFTGAEKAIRLNAWLTVVVCQKSKVNDWYQHFVDHYNVNVVDLTTIPAAKIKSVIDSITTPTVFIINYDLIWRRPELKKLHGFTLLLDESSLIQNENSKRSRFILKMVAENVILLSGTPTNGKYENLWSQLHLLGWKIPKDLFLRQYVEFHYDDSSGFPRMVIDGYKNVERLKRKMREYGCQFLKTDEVVDLPDQMDQTIRVPVSKEYKKFKKSRIVTVENTELVGDCSLTKLLYERELCGQYCQDKLEAFQDLVESTNDRLIVFYNFTAELTVMAEMVHKLGRPLGVVNGNLKEQKVIEKDGAVLFVQYQAGAMGLNLQKANKIIYYTPPLSSELFEQSRKRVHRIGQSKTCFYYYLTCQGSVEEHIYKTLAKRKDYTDKLFEEEES